VLIFSSLFIVQFFLFCCFVLFTGGGGQSAQGAMLVYPRGGWGNTVRCLVLTCWSAKCLPGRFGVSLWWCSSPPVFSV
jgi:hypothetical protein